DDEHLSPNQRAIIALRVHGMTDGKPDRDTIYDTAVSKPSDFAALFLSLGTNSPNCEMFVNGRWYPITLKAQVQRLYDAGRRSKAVLLHGQFALCEQIYPLCFRIYPETFVDESGRRIERTVREVLDEFQLRPVQTVAATFNLKLVRAERLAREHGKLVQVSG